MQLYQLLEDEGLKPIEAAGKQADPYKHEVDAILTENEITPIEIKYGKIETKGLSFFMDKFKIKEGFIISKDEEGEIKADGRKIKIIPAWKWLLAMNSARAGRGLV